MFMRASRTQLVLVVSLALAGSSLAVRGFQNPPAPSTAAPQTPPIATPPAPPPSPVYSKLPGNPWPPAKKGGPTSPALSPAEEMKTFSVPPGFHVELVAAEPLVDS